MSNPLSADLASPYIHGNNPKKKRDEKLAPADLQHEQERDDFVARLYADSREPPPPRKRH